MPKITEEELEAVQVRLFKSDLVKLRRMFAKEFGVNKAIRAIVRTYLRQAEAKAAVTIDRAEAAASQNAELQESLL